MEIIQGIFSFIVIVIGIASIIAIYTGVSGVVQNHVDNALEQNAYREYRDYANSIEEEDDSGYWNHNDEWVEFEPEKENDETGYWNPRGVWVDYEDEDANAQK